MDEHQKDYIELLRRFSRLKDSSCPSKESIKKYHEACTIFELQINCKTNHRMSI